MKKLIILVTIFLSTSWSVFAQEPYFQTGHTHDILDVKFSPDDSQLISYSAADGRLCLWEVKTGRLMWVTKTGFIQKGDEHYNLQEFYWSEDGKTLITKSDNGTYQTWDSKSGTIQALSDLKPNIRLIVPDKKSSPFVKKYNEISLIDPETKQPNKIKKFGNNSAFDTSNDGSMIAEGGSWGDASIRITNVKTGKFWWLDGHPSVIGGIVFSPDGKYLAVGGSDKIIYIFDIAKQGLVNKLIGNTRPINSLAFSPRGEILVSAEKYGVLRVWNWREGKLIQDIKSVDDIGIEKVSFGPDGRYFLTKSDRTEFRLWDATTLKIVRNFRTAEGYESSGGSMSIGYDAVPVNSATFSNDGKRIISAHEDNSIRIWSVEDGKQIKKFNVCEKTPMVMFSRDDKSFLVYCDKDDHEQIKIFDSVSGRETHKFDDEETGFIEAISISPNGKYFATSDIGSDVFLWDLNKSKPIRKFEIGFSGDDAIAFSPDGKTFAIGGRNQNLFLFDTETGNKTWQLIPSYQLGELEKKLGEEKDKRGSILNEKKTTRDNQAAIETERYKKQVYITFDHYGDMSDPGEKKMVESDEPKESKVAKSTDNSNAVWLRLHNDSPLPIKIPTQSMYFPNGKCFFTFTNGKRVNGLCDNREISVWHGLKDKNDKWIPFGFDFGSSAYLLPNTSVLFPVPREILRNNNSIVFDFTFLKDTDDGKVEDYGTAKPLKFGEAGISRK